MNLFISQICSNDTPFGVSLVTCADLSVNLLGKASKWLKFLGGKISQYSACCVSRSGYKKLCPLHTVRMLGDYDNVSLQWKVLKKVTSQLVCSTKT